MQNTASLTDEKVISSIKEGEIEAFSYIVKKYTQPIFRFINGKVFDKQEVDDIVQNIFLSFYKAINRFDEKKSILPYLYEIARNELKMYYRSRKQTLPLSDNLVVKEDDVSQDMREFEVNELIKKLPADQQKALVLAAEGYSYQDIAKRLKKPLNTIRTIIRRGRMKIAQLVNYEKS